MDIFSEYLLLRRKAIEKQFSHMNDMQKRAVFCTEGPLLILAGAGSGKTTVIVNRIANLIKFGDTYGCTKPPCEINERDIGEIMRAIEDDSIDEVADLLRCNAPAPWQILAITFTNKAAGELKERLVNILGDEGNDVWASTFHSMCALMLRRDADRLGYDGKFTIYDTDDQKRLIKECMKQLSMSEKIFPPRAIISEISNAKDNFISPKGYAEKYGSQIRLKKIAEIYALYQQKLKKANAMDFDDLIYNTVKLLSENEDIRRRYQQRFRYIMVDEYQDTNALQYMLISLLVNPEHNLCVVGDDDQSIYKFRGATIENILSFEKSFPETKVIKLEQNYRSTQTILDAANKVIGKNENRKDKKLWTANGRGDRLIVNNSSDEQDEARFIADTVLDNVNKGAKYSDHAVLYRMNAQAGAIERALVKSGVPYRVLVGLRFYEHKEIKDVLAYLSVINNSEDELHLLRIINEPKRGIGQTTVEKAQAIAAGEGIPLFEVISRADEYYDLQRSAKQLKTFAELIDSLSDIAGQATLEELYEAILEDTGYMPNLRVLAENDPKEQARIENLEEFSSTIQSFMEDGDGGLSEFLEEISLMTDVDNYDRSADAVVLMTIHAAKGLEFPFVFLPGMEEGIFPSQRSATEPGELEEERRLAYVAITRAKLQLYISCCSSRMLFGQRQNYIKKSRFVRDIPDSLIEETGETTTVSFAHNGYEGMSSSGADYSLNRSGRIRSSGFGAQHSFAPPKSSVGMSQKSASPSQNYSTGDLVQHSTFGSGKVLSVKPMGNDMLLEISFDKVGTKKIMANFAKLKKQ